MASNKTQIQLEEVVPILRARTAERSSQQGLLVGISGIDGSGKGYIAKQLAETINGNGLSAVIINVDGWLNLPSVRFNPFNPAQHFYEHALRMAELFEQMILPLKQYRSVNITMDFAEETAHEFVKREFAYTNVDVILLEGIYLFKKQYRPYFDFAIWIECSFETALERAVHRSQEGLPPDQTMQAYHTIYFPAQRIHFAKDDPAGSSDYMVNND